MDHGLPILLLLVPALFSGLCGILKSPTQILAAVVIGASIFLGLSIFTEVAIFKAGIISEFGDWLYIDHLSAFHILLLGINFFVSSLYAYTYFGEEIKEGTFFLRESRKLGMLWFGSMGAMAMVLVCGNLGLMWVGIEATTLVTAFLICIHVKPLALEAMWKYLLVCSVGIAFAFIGTLLVGTATQNLGIDSSEVMLWRKLISLSGKLDPHAMKLAFIFILVGYGTKAGLAPMHSWLPDAHSQAPAPVSAIFSGFMLSTAMYCIMRYLPLVEGATGLSGWGLNMLIGLGLLSILIAAAFISFQTDSKRLLAYSSVEHLGIIALGLGLGGVGTFAALWHTMNHSLSKTLAFFSAGRLGQIYGTHEIDGMSGAMRGNLIWGGGLLVSLLALIGIAPFAIFMSELLIVKAAVDSRAYISMAIFLIGVGIIFIEVLKHAIAISWGDQISELKRPYNFAKIDTALAIGLFGSLLLLGLWLPRSLWSAIEQAAQVIRGQI